jgi:hypothetical protein
MISARFRRRGSEFRCERRVVPQKRRQGGRSKTPSPTLATGAGNQRRQEVRSDQRPRKKRVRLGFRAALLTSKEVPPWLGPRTTAAVGKAYWR